MIRGFKTMRNLTTDSDEDCWMIIGVWQLSYTLFFGNCCEHVLCAYERIFAYRFTVSNFFKCNCHDQHSCYLHRLYMDFSQPLQAEFPWQWWDLPYKCAISCIVWSLSISTTYVIRDFYVPRNLCIEIFWYQLRPVVTNYGLIFLVTDVIPPDCHLQRLSPGETEAVPSNAVRVTTESLSRFAVPVSTSST